jgi:ribosomal protein S18 acetylase RimI-like enzyme
VIRRATPTDHTWITQLASHVYVELGDYEQIIPSWLLHPGVLAYLDEDRGVDLRGFILLGFYEPPDSGGVCVADLLAIAVSPVHQRRGVGRALLHYAVELAELIGGKNGVEEIRLTVAETNHSGRRLFDSAGFEVLDADHGLYDGGQRAIRMTRPLLSRGRVAAGTD